VVINSSRVKSIIIISIRNIKENTNQPLQATSTYFEWLQFPVILGPVSSQLDILDCLSLQLTLFKNDKESKPLFTILLLTLKPSL
jgi:hypothetical protein